MSPVIAALHLEDYGLAWTQSPDVLAHPTPDGRGAVLRRQVEATAEGLHGFAPEDGVA